MFRAKIDFKKLVSDYNVKKVNAGGRPLTEAASYTHFPKNIDVVGYGPQEKSGLKTFPYSYKEVSPDFKASKSWFSRSKPKDPEDYVEVSDEYTQNVYDLDQENSYIEYGMRAHTGHSSGNYGLGGLDSKDIQVPFRALEILDEAVNSLPVCLNKRVDLRPAAQSKIREAFNKYPNQPRSFVGEVEREGVFLNLLSPSFD